MPPVIGHANTCRADHGLSGERRFAWDNARNGNQLTRNDGDCGLEIDWRGAALLRCFDERKVRNLCGRHAQNVRCSRSDSERVAEERSEKILMKLANGAFAAA